MVDGFPGREVVGQQSPGAAAANDVEDGVEDLTGAVHLGTPGSVGERQMRFEEGPLFVREVALVCFSHARYPTERALQHPFSDSFLTEFYEVLIRRVLRTSALRSSEKFTYSMMRPSSPVAMMPLLLQEEVEGWQL